MKSKQVTVKQRAFFFDLTRRVKDLAALNEIVEISRSIKIMEDLFLIALEASDYQDWNEQVTAQVEELQKKAAE